MKTILFLSLFLTVGCATRYIVPGSRFITPETQGGSIRGQIEFQQAGATQLTADTSQGSVDEGVTYQETTRSGFLLSGSFFEQFDMFWSHTGSAPSMVGAKFQFLGTSRTANGAGHKMSVAASFGGNEHETEDESVEFELSGQEFMLLYGYRINEFIFPYSSFSLGRYQFEGKVRSSDPVLDGLRPEYSTQARSLNGGVEFSFEAFFVKVEATYQQLITTDTKDENHLTYGYSMGFSW